MNLNGRPANGDAAVPAAALAEFNFVTTTAVNWADQDALGHVNHTMFLRWFEANRLYYFEEVGLWPCDPASGVSIILASLSCNYRSPISYPDRIHVGLNVAKIGAKSIALQQVALSEKLNVVAAEAQFTIVVFDYRMAQSCPIPDHIREALERAFKPLKTVGEKR